MRFVYPVANYTITLNSYNGDLGKVSQLPNYQNTADLSLSYDEDICIDIMELNGLDFIRPDDSNTNIIADIM